MSGGVPARAAGAEPLRLGRQGLRFRVYVLVAVGVLVPAALVARELELRLRSDELVELQLALKKTRAELDATVARVARLEHELEAGGALPQVRVVQEIPRDPPQRVPLFHNIGGLRRAGRPFRRRLRRGGRPR